MSDTRWAKKLKKSMLETLLSDSSEHFNQTVEDLHNSLVAIRTSRANPVLLEDVIVEVYNGRYPLKELASISAPQPQLLVVTPWDLSIIPQIEKAVRTSPLGFNPTVFDVNINVPIPPLTEEKRLQLSKIVAQKVEEAKVRIRQIRHEKIKSAEEMERVKKVSEDEVEHFKKELQERVERVNGEIEGIKKRKEKELLEI